MSKNSPKIDPEEARKTVEAAVEVVQAMEAPDPNDPATVRMREMYQQVRKANRNKKMAEVKPGQVWQDEDGGVSVILWVKEEENRICYDYRQSTCDSRPYPCYSSFEGFSGDDAPLLLTDRDQAMRSIPGELKAMAEAFYGEDPEEFDEEDHDLLSLDDFPLR